MENKKKKIDIINVAGNPERKRKTQQEKQVLDTITKEMYKREKMEEEIKRRKINQIKRNKKKIRIGIGIASTLVLSIVGSYRITKSERNAQNNDIKQEEIKFTSRKEKLEIEKENLRAFLNNLYIEQLEEISGKVLLTTAEITLNSASYEDYAFVIHGTGEIITHGDEPSITEQKLINDGISYDIIENLKVYKVYNTGGDIIDCITMKDGEPKKVTIGEQYGQNTVSILEKMGSVIPDGIDCIGYLENGKQNDISIGKAKFMQSLEKFKKTKEDKEVEEMDYEFEL